MNKRYCESGVSPSGQRGAVLAVTLILLLVMTVLAAANIQSTSLELRMATANNTRQVTFQAAETALKKVEAQIEAAGYIKANHQGCTASASCYDVNCTGGTCFSGTYTGGTKLSCDITPTVTREPVWRDTTLDVWATANRTRTIPVPNLNQDPQYIVEFLCFVERGDGTAFNASFPNDGAPLYRITVRAQSDNGKSNVMLQSTYRLNE